MMKWRKDGQREDARPYYFQLAILDLRLPVSNSGQAARQLA